MTARVIPTFHAMEILYTIHQEVLLCEMYYLILNDGWRVVSE